MAHSTSYCTIFPYPSLLQDCPVWILVFLHPFLLLLPFLPFYILSLNPTPSLRASHPDLLHIPSSLFQSSLLWALCPRLCPFSSLIFPSFLSQLCFLSILPPGKTLPMSLRAMFPQLNLLLSSPSLQPGLLIFSLGSDDFWHFKALIQLHPSPLWSGSRPQSLPCCRATQVFPRWLCTS